MATRKKKTTAIATWDEELAKYAAEAADQEEGVGGGQFFSTAGARLAFNGNNLPNNEVAVILLDSIHENTLYDGAYDPDNVTSPICYAFGRSDEIMTPHSDVAEPVSDQCEGCPKNEWGSADTGRGKACTNRRRIAVISAGTITNGVFEPVENPADIRKDTLAYLKVPPTSINGYAQYVKQIAGTMKRPPFGVFTRVYLEPDTKTQFKMHFEVLDVVPDKLVPVVIERHKEAREVIEFPYQKATGAEPKKPAKKAVRKTSRKSKATRRKF